MFWFTFCIVGKRMTCLKTLEQKPKSEINMLVNSLSNLHVINKNMFRPGLHLAYTHRRKVE